MSIEQCKYCAFLYSEDQTTPERAARVEAKYQAIRESHGAPKRTRRVFVGGGDDKTETCFINSPGWDMRNENVYCDDWIDRSLQLETALDLREARDANNLARDANTLARDSNTLARDANRTASAARIWAVIAAIIATIAIAVPYVISYLRGYL